MTIITNNILLDLFGVIVALFAIIYTYFKWTFQYWEKRNVPIPEKPTFPFGNVGNPVSRKKTIGQLVADAYFKLKKQKQRFGGFYSMTSPQLVVVDTDIIRNILTKDFQHFTDRGLFYNEKANPLSAHMVAVELAKWRNLRTKLTPTFTSGKMKLMFSTLVECGGPLVKALDKQVEKGTPIDIKDVLGCFTTDIIGSCAFGLEFKSFEEEDAEFRKQGRRLFSTPNFRTALRNAFILSLPELARRFNVSSLDQDQIDFFLDTVRNNIDFRQKNNYARNDFFQLLMDIKKQSEEDDNETPFTLADFAAQVFVFFLGGFETSSTTMTFAFYELARHPEIQQKVREEVNLVLKQHGGKITYEAMQDMKLLNSVINESLRLYPPLPVLLRRCTKNYKISDSDFILEKDIRVVIPLLAIQRDEEYFPEPEKFKPERFNEANKANIKPFTHLPFGDGPRNCIGLRFGMMQSKVGIAILLKNFEFSLNSKTKDPLTFNPRAFVTTADGDIWLDAKRIKE